MVITESCFASGFTFTFITRGLPMPLQPNSWNHVLNKFISFPKDHLWHFFQVKVCFEATACVTASSCADDCGWTLKVILEERGISTLLIQVFDSGGSHAPRVSILTHIRSLFFFQCLFTESWTTAVQGHFGYVGSYVDRPCYLHLLFRTGSSELWVLITWLLGLGLWLFILFQPILTALLQCFSMLQIKCVLCYRFL